MYWAKRRSPAAFLSFRCSAGRALRGRTVTNGPVFPHVGNERLMDALGAHPEISQERFGL